MAEESTFCPANYRWPLVVVGLLAVMLAYTWMSPEVSAPNERSRLYLTHSILESGSIAIDDQVEQFGTPYDVAHRDGEYFTDKAPGSSLVALPAIATYSALGGDIDSIEKTTNVARLGVMLPVTVLSLLVFWGILSWLGIGREMTAAMVALLALSTNLFHYGTAFYGHGIVLFFSLAAAFFVVRNLEATDEDSSTLVWPLAAGLAGGLAVTVEYQAVFVLAGLAAGFVAIERHRAPGPLVAFGAGAALPVAGLLAYHWAAFGDPLTTSYEFLIHEAPEQKHDEGLWGVTFPSWEALYGLLFSPSRGLVMCAPIILVGIAGLGLLWQRVRWLAIFAGITILGYLWMATSARDVWYAGWSFGPRLLIPMYGLAALSAAVTYEWLCERIPVGAAALLGVFVAAIGYNVFVTAMFPEIPPSVTAPLTSVAIPVAGLSAPSPNLGMALVGLEDLASVLPLAVGALAAAGFAVWAARPRTGISAIRTAVGIAVGIFVFAVVAFGYPEAHDADRIDDFVDNVSQLRTTAR